MTIDEFFECAPDEGAFEWDDVEAGDWHVYCCDEKDCPVQWHKIAYATKMGRDEQGRRWVEVEDVDSDGNWDFCAGYDEREGDTEENWAAFYKDHLENMTDDYFKGWIAYWEHVAETGKDVLGELNDWDGTPPSMAGGKRRKMPKSEIKKIARKAVEENTKYLNMGKDKGNE